ncbi:MAG: diguanylate cyclase domain protein [Acidobacteriaceae bacterium]|nr:diguanylate cyclase domain protein [Acidobacteriaceae bacterium]
MAQSFSNSRPKVALDEASFQQLLAAASVMQQHNDRLLAKDPAVSSTEALSEVAQTQKLIQSGKLNFGAATSLIAERLLRNTKAAGVAIGVVEEDRLAYTAASGDAAGQCGTRVPLDYGLAADCFLSGEVQRCADAEFDSRIPFSVRRKGNIQSFIAVPIRHERAVVGAIEVRFAQPQGFQEQDVRTCELMAGLLTETLSRSQKHAPPLEKFAGELAPFLTEEIFQALDPSSEDKIVNADGANTREDSEDHEDLLSQLSFLPPQTGPSESLSAESVQDRETEPLSEDVNLSSESVTPDPDPEVPAGTHCRGCGHQFTPEEVFCGSCGIARASKETNSREPSDGYLQHKWATLWYMKEAVRRRESETEPPTEELPAFRSTMNREPEATRPLSVPAQFNAESSAAEESFRPVSASDENFRAPEESFFDPFLPEPKVAETESTTQNDTWTMQETQSEEQESPEIKTEQTADESKKFAWRPWLLAQLQNHRADIYIGVAAILLVIALAGWGAPETMTSSSKAPTPAAPQLTTLEKLLVATGLAEAPEVPQVYLGNPDTQVWLDVHTALYYCPGTTLYGKTTGGRLAPQRSAQQDHFDPASGRACE